MGCLRLLRSYAKFTCSFTCLFRCHNLFGWWQSIMLIKLALPKINLMLFEAYNKLTFRFDHISMQYLTLAFLLCEVTMITSLIPFQYKTCQRLTLSVLAFSFLFLFLNLNSITFWSLFFCKTKTLFTN